MTAAEWPEPAYVIRTARLTIRCYERPDVRAVHRAVLDNVDALSPWMPWVEHEPMPISERAALLRTFRARFDSGEDLIYGIFETDGERYLGGCGLHQRVGPGGLEIGYWIVRDRWGDGLATEAAAALTRVGFERMGAKRMELRIDPSNVRSLAIPPKLGYTKEGTVRGRICIAGELKPIVVFGMHADEFAGSPCAEATIALEGFLPDA